MAFYIFQKILSASTHFACRRGVDYITIALMIKSVAASYTTNGLRVTPLLIDNITTACQSYTANGLRVTPLLIDNNTMACFSFILSMASRASLHDDLSSVVCQSDRNVSRQ